MSLRTLKKTVRQMLLDGKLEEVAELSRDQQKVLGTLITLTFDTELLVVWRAVEAMGLSIREVARVDRSQAKEHMRRLYWLITEEAGAVFWRAPECMAECCASEPKFFKTHIPIAFHLLETLEEEDLEHFRPGAIWAIGRLKDLARDDLPTVLPLLIDALDRPESQARGMAAWCLGEVGEAQVMEGRPDLLEDQGPVFLYRNRLVEETVVGQVVRDALGANP
jgi:hypothetical protein